MHGNTEVDPPNGAIETEVPAIGENGLRIRTNNGSIEMSIAADLNIDLEARTSNGKIKLDDLEVIEQEISKGILRGKIDNGGIIGSRRSPESKLLGQIPLSRSFYGYVPIRPITGEYSKALQVPLKFGISEPNGTRLTNSIYY